MTAGPEPAQDGVPMSLMDKLKKKAEELDLETKAKQLQDAATQAAKQAREKAGDYTAQNREKIDGYVETATTKIDEKTEGKYADKVAKVKEHVGRGVDKVAEGHASGPSTATGAAAAAGATDVTGGEPFPVDPDAPAPVSASPLEAPAPIDRPTPVDERRLGGLHLRLGAVGSLVERLAGDLPGRCGRGEQGGCRSFLGAREPLACRFGRALERGRGVLAGEQRVLLRQGRGL